MNNLLHTKKDLLMAMRELEQRQRSRQLMRDAIRENPKVNAPIWNNDYANLTMARARLESSIRKYRNGTQ